MSTIAFVNGKGGSGKTTLALGFTFALAEAGHRLSYIDADQQRTFTASIAHVRAHVSGTPAADALDRIQEAAARRPSHHTVIDGPPRLGSEERSLHLAMPSAEFAILPCAPSFTDAWSTLDSLKALRTRYPSVRYAIALTRLDSRTAFSRLIREKLTADGVDVPILRTEIPDLACFTIMPAFGWHKLTRTAQKSLTDFALEVLSIAQTPTV